MEAELRAGVDAEFADFLANHRDAHPHAAPPPPAKPAGGKTKKPAGGKPGAAAAGAPRPAPPPKPLPGAALVGCGVTVQAMLAQLVALGLVAVPHASASLGAFEVGAGGGCRGVERGGDSPWAPPAPTPSQAVRAAIQSAVLPLRVPGLRAQLRAFCESHGVGGDSGGGGGGAPLPPPPVARGLLLYGPPGCGKTHLALGVALAAGALVVNLSAAAVVGALPGRDGGARLLHLAFEVARAGGLGRVVLLAEGLEELAPASGGAKRAPPAAGGAGAGAAGGGPPAGAPASDADGSPSRLKRDLAAYALSLGPDAPAVLIGCSAAPWLVDGGVLDACFDRRLHVAAPGLDARAALWRVFAARRVREVVVAGALAGHASPAECDAAAEERVLTGVDFDGLAAVSEGYTAGAIHAAVGAALGAQRVQRRLDAEAGAATAGTPGEGRSGARRAAPPSLAAEDFLAPLSRCRRQSREEAERFAAFAAASAGRPWAAAAPALPAGKGGKGKAVAGGRGKA